MGELRHIGDIQLNEDMPFLRREWRVQRIGWAVMAVVVLLALLGVFGRGPMSTAESGNRNSFGVAYDRIIRHGAQTDIEFRVAAGLSSDSTFRLYLSKHYLEQFKVEDIIPEPASSGTSGTLVFYEFERPNPRQPALITFSLTPLSYWQKRATVALPGVTAIRFNQFVLP